MMRRGGRGTNLLALRRGHEDHAIPSALRFRRGWAVGNYVKVVGLAAFSVAISILVWSLRPGSPPAPHILGHNLQPRSPGIVFPLYQYYQQYANGSHVVGGSERWRGSRVGNGRAILSEDPLFELRWVHRSHGDWNRELFIEMKLGDPPKPFYFNIDTGSGTTWVHCVIKDHSSIQTMGPNGLFVSKEDSIIKCIERTESLCRAHQQNARCKEEEGYMCFFSIIYADRSAYVGVVVNETMTLPMQDASERDVFNVFGCVLEKRLIAEKLPLLTDGVVGLAKCEGSLVDQLWTSDVISEKVLGICMAKEIRRRPLGLRPAGRVGFISLGMDFEEKFDEKNLVWSKLVETEMNCLLTAKLHFIIIGNREISSLFESGDSLDVGIKVAFDTGSEMSYFRKDVYDLVLEELETITRNGLYIEGQDYIPRPSASDERVCWEYRGRKRKHGARASPMDDFPALKFGFEGFPTMKSPVRTELHSYIVRPENYLTWNAERRLVCLNILEELDDPLISLFGVHMMREHLFVFDMQNHRVRWKPSQCEL